MIHDGKTIIACASGAHAHAAIAVIRLSGFQKLSDLQPFFTLSLTKVQPRQMVRSKIVEGASLVDDICLCFFSAPASYTGENLLELYVHGNTLNVERILKLFQTNKSIRAAKPGEFSLRALQNKKLTLSQVEGLDLFLNASTPLALTQGMELLHGELHHAYLQIFESYKLHKASLELLLDFHEDVGEKEAYEQLNATWKSLFAHLQSLAKRLDPHSSRLLRPEIVIAGLPNAGKSTLFNLLLGEDRAIVSAVAGTTRDYIAEDISIEGVTYRLVDTAGVRETSDAIESRGIELTRERLSRAFYSVLLVNPLASNEGELKKLTQYSFDKVIFTHADSPGFNEAAEKIAQALVLSGQEHVSLVKSDTLPGLLRDINKKYMVLSGQSPLLLERHKHVISNVYSAAQRYHLVLQNESDIAILSHELNALGHCLQELLGIVSPDEVLDHIFANFCIGK
jgi:tRNA modification GTPase